MKFLKWSDDRWKSEQGSILKYDKLEHFLLGFIGLFSTLFFFSYIGFWYCLIIWESLGIGWEIKDGLFTYDGKHIQGFSWKDLLADNYGFMAAVITWSVVWIIFIAEYQ